MVSCVLTYVKPTKMSTNDSTGKCPALLFHSPVPFTYTQFQKWLALTSLLKSPYWWWSLLRDSCIIAGGAALYMADDLAILNDVGDVDVWVPLHIQPRIPDYVKELVEWCDHTGLKYIINVQKTIITLKTPIINVQFIMSPANCSVSDILSAFDFDCVQCAIVFDASLVFASTHTVGLIRSQAAVDAHTSRIIAWQNLGQWPFGISSDAPPPPRIVESMKKCNIDERIQKLAKKKFFIHHIPDDIILHDTGTLYDSVRHLRPEWNTFLLEYSFHSLDAVWPMLVQYTHVRERTLEEQLQGVSLDASTRRFAGPVFDSPRWIPIGTGLQM